MSSLGSVVLYGQAKREYDKNRLSHFRKWDHESVSQCLDWCLKLTRETGTQLYNIGKCISNRELSMGDLFDTIVYIFMQISENYINKNKHKCNRCNEKY